MLKFLAVALAAAVLAGGYSFASESISPVGSDTVLECCWGGGWGGGNGGGRWGNGGGCYGYGNGYYGR